MAEYLFRSNITNDEVEIEADSFDEACYEMFGDLGDGTKLYDHNEYELITIDGRY